MSSHVSLSQVLMAGHDEDDAAKVMALCEHLECQPDEVEKLRYDHFGLTLFSAEGKDFAVGTDDESYEAASKEIEQSAWAFNSSFLAEFTGLPEEMFKAVQDKCEDANDAVLQCINQAGGGLEDFVDLAISADGRGHFLAGYDHEEHLIVLDEPDDEKECDRFWELTDTDQFYIYRTN